MHFYQDAFSAIRDANYNAPRGIAYRHQKGWYIYDLTHGIEDPKDIPEILCYQPGKIPVAIGGEGSAIISNLIEHAMKSI